MKKNITLKITSKQYIEKLEPVGQAYRKNLELDDSVEIITEGTLFLKERATYISYYEPCEQGETSQKTLLKATDKGLKITRYGDENNYNLEMALEPGVRNITRFKVPMLGSLDMEVYAHSYGKELSDEGYGKIFVDYKIIYGDDFARRTKLDIEVRPS